MTTDDSLHGRVVLSGDGLAIGEVTRLLVDTKDWRVRALEIKVRREAAERIGLHHSMFRHSTIEVPIEHVQSTGDAIILSVPVGALRPEPTPASPAPQH